MNSKQQGFMMPYPSVSRVHNSLDNNFLIIIYCVCKEALWRHTPLCPFQIEYLPTGKIIYFIMYAIMFLWKLCGDRFISLVDDMICAAMLGIWILNMNFNSHNATIEITSQCKVSLFIFYYGNCQESIKQAA